MLQHVAGHIVREEISADMNRCGFCGRLGCQIALVKTSGNGTKKLLGQSSDCPYFVPHKLEWMKKSTKTCPSSNHPVQCPLCPRVYWSYNMIDHYKSCHVE